MQEIRPTRWSTLFLFSSILHRPDFGVILDRLVELKKDYENIDFVSSGDDNKTSLGAHRKSVVKVSNKH